MNAAPPTASLAPARSGGCSIAAPAPVHSPGTGARNTQKRGSGAGVGAAVGVVVVNVVLVVEAAVCVESKVLQYPVDVGKTQSSGSQTMGIGSLGSPTACWAKTISAAMTCAAGLAAAPPSTSAFEIANW